MQKNSRDKKTALHRQFVLDRVAHFGPVGAIASKTDWRIEGSGQATNAPNNAGRRVIVKGLTWQFQSFQRNVQGVGREYSVRLSSGRAQTQTSLIDRFSQNPKSADAELIKYNLKVSNPTGEFPAQQYVALAKAKQLLLEAVRSTNFKDLFDDLAEDLEISE